MMGAILDIRIFDEQIGSRMNREEKENIVQRSEINAGNPDGGLINATKIGSLFAKGVCTL